MYNASAALADQILTVLKDARALFPTASNWTKGTFEETETFADGMCRSCYCLTGAIRCAGRARGHLGTFVSLLDLSANPVVHGAFSALYATLKSDDRFSDAGYWNDPANPGKALVRWNDFRTTTYADVVTLLDLTIERLEGAKVRL